jgi:hypothetical protein
VLSKRIASSAIKPIMPCQAQRTAQPQELSLGRHAGSRPGDRDRAVFSYAHPDAGLDDPRFAEGTWNLSKRPVVAYSWSDRRNFLPDGRLRGQPSKEPSRPGTASIAMARRMPRIRAPSIPLTTNAHVRAGMMCIDCHPLTGSGPAERLRHQIAKGHSPVGTVRDDLAGQGVKTCTGVTAEDSIGRPVRECPRRRGTPGCSSQASAQGSLSHLSHRLQRLPRHGTAGPGPPVARHERRPGNGLHGRPSRGGFAGRRIYAKPAKAPWAPWMLREDRYTAAVPKWMQMFGRTAAQWRDPHTPAPCPSGGTGVKGLTVIDAALPDGGRLKRQTVASDRISRECWDDCSIRFPECGVSCRSTLWTEKGAIVAQPRPGQELHNTVEHSVVPPVPGSHYTGPRKAGGMQDCHQGNSPFFRKDGPQGHAGVYAKGITLS